LRARLESTWTVSQNPQVVAQLVCRHVKTAVSFGTPVGLAASHAAAQVASAHAS
jgi:hypothetical protein